MFRANTTVRRVLLATVLLIAASAAATTVTAQTSVLDPGFDVGQSTINVGDEITLDATNTQVYEDTLANYIGINGFTYSLDYDWTVIAPDGTTSSSDALDGDTTTYTFDQAGDYQVTLEVTLTYSYQGTSQTFSSESLTQTITATEGDASAGEEYGTGPVSSGNPFGNASDVSLDVNTVIDRIVSWNVDGEIDGQSYTQSEVIQYLVEWNTAVTS